MRNLSKLLLILTLVLSLAVINNGKVLANAQADNYLITGSKNLMQADSFHVEFNIDISGKDYNVNAFTKSDIQNKKQVSKTDFSFSGNFKDKNFSESFQQYVELSQSKDNIYTFDGKQWTRMTGSQKVPAKLTPAEIKFIDDKIKAIFIGVIDNQIILENSEYALIDVKIITEKAKDVIIKEFYPQIKPAERKQIDDIFGNVGDIDIMIKYNKRNGMLEESKLDLTKNVATVANNMIDLWGGNNKNKDLYKSFFQGFNFVITTNYNRFNQIDDIVIPLEAKVGKLVNTDEFIKTGEKISKTVAK